MKYVAVFLAAFTLGYLSFSLLHPVDNKPSDELLSLFEKFLKSEAKNYANADSSEEKLKAADEMYSKMMLLFLSQLELKAPENKPLNVTVTIEPEKKIYVEAPREIVLPPKKQKKKPAKTIAERLMAGTITMTDFRSMMDVVTYLDSNDSRVKKLNGVYIGKMKSTQSRTGLLENVLFEVNQDPEKLMTKFNVKDVYDNTNMNIYEKTSEVFRSVPGDENFIFITKNMSFIVFDLRTNPIEGKVYQMRTLRGDFDLRKKTK
jgi:hypothetical protein